VRDTPRIGPGLRLLGAHPNPAHSSTRIRFASGERRAVTLRVYDSSGRLMRTLVDGRVIEGNYAVEAPWDGRDETGHAVAPGVYFYELRSGTEAASGRLVILR